MDSAAPTPVDRAVKAAGGQSALARLVGVKPQSVQTWQRQKRIPAGRVLAIEAAVGIPRHELRSDLYPSPSVAA